MPSKPKHPCAYPGCPELTDGRYCEKHRKKVNQNYEKYGRDKKTKRRYGRCWKRIRDRYAAEHPFCELCYEHGVLVPVEEIHHKKPLSEGGTHDRENLIALCKSCHSSIHARRGDRWGVRHYSDQGRGGQNPQSVSPGGTTRGSRVQNREMKHGGYAHNFGGKEEFRWLEGNQNRQQ